MILAALLLLAGFGRMGLLLPQDSLSELPYDDEACTRGLRNSSPGICPTATLLAHPRRRLLTPPRWPPLNEWGSRLFMCRYLSALQPRHAALLFPWAIRFPGLRAAPGGSLGSMGVCRDQPW